MNNISSNISIEGVSGNGFVLPNGYSWDVQLQNGMKEGRVTVRNNMRMVYAVLYYHHDKLNGLCSFYNRDNIAEGWSCELDREGKESWFVYRNGKKMSRLVKCEELEGFWKEIEIASEKLISICQYNEEHVKNGKCYLYEGNSIHKIVSFDNGQEKECFKEFNGEEMTEYDNGGNEIYIGGFEDSLKNDYPRNGEGCELKDGECIYCGNWKINKRDGYGWSLIYGLVIYDGEWKENLPHGKGILRDENDKVKYNGNWINGQLKLNDYELFDYVSNRIVYYYPVRPVFVNSKYVELRKIHFSTGNELMSLLNNTEMKKSMSEIVIEKECGNELRIDLNICRLDQLGKLIVKKNSLKRLNSLVISNNSELESIVIENAGWETGAFFYIKSMDLSSIF